jgi:hypothetical protein
MVLKWSSPVALYNRDVVVFNLPRFSVLGFGMSAGRRAKCSVDRKGETPRDKEKALNTMLGMGVNICNPSYSKVEAGRACSEASSHYESSFFFFF